MGIDKLGRVLASFVCAVIAFMPLQSSAYSYAVAEDSMVLVFKQGIMAVQTGNWTEVQQQFEKGVKLQDKHQFTADALVPGFEQAVKAEDVSLVAEKLAHLVYLSIREKLHDISKNTNDMSNNKSRLMLAQKAYVDVLDGNVKKKSPEISKAIFDQFEQVLESLGNPGLFGMGKKAPDPAKTKQAVVMIEEKVVSVFPSFR